MGAPPETVWSWISDVTQIGRFSPETFEAKHNEKGPIYWTICTVTECSPGQVFAFAVRSP